LFCGGGREKKAAGGPPPLLDLSGYTDGLETLSYEKKQP
jgi:hypothetical protein